VHYKRLIRYMMAAFCTALLRVFACNFLHYYTTDFSYIYCNTEDSSILLFFMYKVELHQDEDLLVEDPSTDYAYTYADYLSGNYRTDWNF
jgi:hypothetical protein